MQVEQMKAQMSMQADQTRMQHEFQLEQARMQMQAAVDQNRQSAEQQQKSAEIAQEAQLEQMRSQYKQSSDEAAREIERWKAQLASDTAIYIKTMDVNSAASLAVDRQEGESLAGSPAAPQGQAASDTSAQSMKEFTAAMIAAISRPKTIVRDANGRAVGVQ